MNDYSRLSHSLTKKLDKNVKKENGIYFTPPLTISKTFAVLEPYIENVKDILEPSCGSCEYILRFNEKYKNKNITGIEFNKTIYDSIKSIENDNSNIKLYNEDFLKFNFEQTYDLIIGNPPYFVMKKKDVDKSYYDYFEGRPNLFILFIIKSLDLLNDNGILSFILPRNFLNGSTYDKTRKLINENFEILNISECQDNYIETKQDTILLVIKKRSSFDNKKYIFKMSDSTIFGNPNKISEIESLCDNSSTLKNLGFDLYIGKVVWNQCKDVLTEDSSKTLLIYSSDIKNNELSIKKYKNEYKKNYINKKGEKDMILVLNRGYGKGEYKFQYCLLDIDKEYLVENHLICVKYTKNVEDKNELKNIYLDVIKSLNSEKTKKFINLYFGNNAINSKELKEIMPIYNFNK
jgi:tRNA1(Val) A37 N6-methylase TrmN6